MLECSCKETVLDTKEVQFFDQRDNATGKGTAELKWINVDDCPCHKDYPGAVVAYIWIDDVTVYEEYTRARISKAWEDFDELTEMYRRVPEGPPKEIIFSHGGEITIEYEPTGYKGLGDEGRKKHLYRINFNLFGNNLTLANTNPVKLVELFSYAAGNAFEELLENFGRLAEYPNLEIKGGVKNEG
jgi:hypothetical protein